MDMSTAKNLAIFGGSVIAVLLVAPLVIALVDRVTGDGFSRLYDATLGAAARAAAGAPAAQTGTTLTGLTEGASGARLVTI